MCNDDFCENSVQQYLSYLDVQVFAGNTYYIIVDGYGGSSGEYEMNIRRHTQLSAYRIYRDGNSDNEVSPDQTFYYDNLDNSDGTYAYEVRAHYAGYGMDSEPTNEVIVTVPGLPAEISLDPESFDFGVVSYGDTLQTNFTISNNGEAPLEWTGVLLEGGSRYMDRNPNLGFLFKEK